MFCVLYFDRNSNNPEELLQYLIDANDSYDAERLFQVFARGESFDIYNITKIE